MNRIELVAMVALVIIALGHPTEASAQLQGGGNRCYFGNNCSDPNAAPTTPTHPPQLPPTAPQPGPTPPVTQPPGGETSSICQFTSGPNPGAIINFVGVGEAPLGTSCQDQLGNRGSIISRSHPFAYMAINLILSSRCYFTMGPLGGQIVDYAQFGKVVIGTPCNDGAGSFGSVIQ